MKVISNQKAGTLTLVPTAKAEKKVVGQIIKVSKPGDLLDYDGRRTDPETGRTVMLTFHANAERKQVKVQQGNLTIISHEFVGGVKLELTASDQQSLDAIRSLRNAVYFGSGGIIFLDSEMVDGKQAVTVTVQQCKHCKANLISRHACEWSTCDACAAKCDHKYIYGAVHGGSAGDIAMGEYCEKCGRGKPEPKGTRQKDQIERELQVEREMGVTVLYKRGSIKGPRHAIGLLRTARRHEKANVRK